MRSAQRAVRNPQSLFRFPDQSPVACIEYRWLHPSTNAMHDYPFSMRWSRVCVDIVSLYSIHIVSTQCAAALTCAVSFRKEYLWACGVRSLSIENGVIREAVQIGGPSVHVAYSMYLASYFICFNGRLCISCIGGHSAQARAAGAIRAQSDVSLEELAKGGCTSERLNTPTTPGEIGEAAARVKLPHRVTGVFIFLSYQQPVLKTGSGIQTLISTTQSTSGVGRRLWCQS